MFYFLAVKIYTRIVHALLEKFANSGCSTRGTKQDIIDEVSDSLQ